MRGVLLEIPTSLLDERARLGVDRFDELWEGVLHMVPPPSFLHQRISAQLLAFLLPRLVLRGIEVGVETGVFRPGSDGNDYRIPDLVFFRPEQPGLVTKRGLEGAPLAILEVRSPGDETYEKFEFWAELGVAEIIVVEPESRHVELYRLAGKKHLATSADDRGKLHVQTLDIRLSTAGNRLRVELDDVTLDI